MISRQPAGDAKCGCGITCPRMCFAAVLVGHSLQTLHLSRKPRVCVLIVLLRSDARGGKECDGWCKDRASPHQLWRPVTTLVKTRREARSQHACGPDSSM